MKHDMYIRRSSNNLEVTVLTPNQRQIVQWLAQVLTDGKWPESLLVIVAMFKMQL